MNHRMFQLPKNTLLIAGASLFADMSTEMLTPILPIFLTQALHANGSVVGLVDGIAQAIRNIIDGFSGPLSDKLRKRKVIAATGYAMSAVAKPLMGLSSMWQAVLGARILDRLGAGARSAPRDAIVASSLGTRDRGRGFGLEALGENAGAFVGPIATCSSCTRCKWTSAPSSMSPSSRPWRRWRSSRSSSNSGPRQTIQTRALLYVHQSFRGVIGDS